MRSKVAPSPTKSYGIYGMQSFGNLHQVWRDYGALASEGQ